MSRTRNFDPRKVATYVWRELILALVLSVGVYVCHVTPGISQMTVPFRVLSLLGAALAIFLAFRNNTSEHRITDVPMSAMCRTNERDVHELPGEKDLPPALQPKDGYLY